MDDEDDYDDDDDFGDDEYYDMNNHYEEQDNLRSNIDGESQLIDPEFFDYQCLTEEDIVKQDFLVLNDINNYQSISDKLQEMDKVLTITCTSNTKSNINNNNNNNTIINSIGDINNDVNDINDAISKTTTANTNTITFKIIPKETSHKFPHCDICMDDNNKLLNDTNSTTIINNNNNEITYSNSIHHHHQLEKNNCNMVALSCNHAYCQRCWLNYVRTQIQQGISPHIECMSVNCHLRVPDQMIFSLLTNQEDRHIREKFIKLTITEYVQSHPRLKYCPGRDCSMIIHSLQISDNVKDVAHSKSTSNSSTNISRKVICNSCQTMFCFNCGLSYHAPTDCLTIKKWLTKCEDDSETSNYISVHTKACPKCKIAIEKNGGCNHMQCFSCKFDFCWICLGDWESHGSEYYECSRYQGNPEVTEGSANDGWSKAYELLKKYLFYFERWDNHARSLKLEQQTLNKIKQRIQDNVMASKGTWIDWQYLLDAAQLLSKCRYTLQYTYPYAYYLESGPRKQLFEYQQAQLEAEIENLSWEVERAENTNRGHIENQMSIAEKWRTTLLNDFYK